MAKSDWEIVKNTKQKPVAEKSPKNGTTKSKSPVASVAASKNAQNGVKAKDQVNFGILGNNSYKINNNIIE